MECSQVQNLLSAYHDRELPRAEAAAVAEHLAGCASCASTLAGFQGMSQLAGELRRPVAAGATWRDIEQQLDAPASAASQERQWRSMHQWIPALAIAATLLVALGIGLCVRYRPREYATESLAAHFDAFLQQFPRDPSAAQNVLLTSFNGRRVDLTEAEKTLGYMPAAGAEIPDGYAVDDVYLLNMPVCKCAEEDCPKEDCAKGGKCLCGGACSCSQIVYRSTEGRLISVFEHDEPQSAWFGTRRAITCQCNGTPTELIQIDAQQLAASWKRGNRYVTVVGAANLEEVKHIMEHLQASATTGPSAHRATSDTKAT